VVARFACNRAASTRVRSITPQSGHRRRSRRKTHGSNFAPMGSDGMRFIPELSVLRRHNCHRARRRMSGASRRPGGWRPPADFSPAIRRSRYTTVRRTSTCAGGVRIGAHLVAFYQRVSLGAGKAGSGDARSNPPKAAGRTRADAHGRGHDASAAPWVRLGSHEFHRTNEAAA